jgi:hypothetical protein
MVYLLSLVIPSTTADLWWIAIFWDYDKKELPNALLSLRVTILTFEIFGDFQKYHFP